MGIYGVGTAVPLAVTAYATRKLFKADAKASTPDGADAAEAVDPDAPPPATGPDAFDRWFTRPEDAPVYKRPGVDDDAAGDAADAAATKELEETEDGGEGDGSGRRHVCRSSGSSIGIGGRHGGGAPENNAAHEAEEGDGPPSDLEEGRQRTVRDERRV